MEPLFEFDFTKRSKSFLQPATSFKFDNLAAGGLAAPHTLRVDGIDSAVEKDNLQEQLQSDFPSDEKSVVSSFHDPDESEDQEMIDYSEILISWLKTFSEEIEGIDQVTGISDL